jgi:Flp pilus assembly protein TadG
MAADFQCAVANGPERRGRLLSRSVAMLGCDRGTVAIETAVGFMLMMAMLLGIMECSVMGYTYAVLEESAREGVRYAIVHGADSSSCNGPSTGCDATAANVIADVHAYANTFAGTITGMSVVVTYPDGVSTGTSRVKVAITQTYVSVFHIPGISQTLTVSSEGRILY